MKPGFFSGLRSFGWAALLVLPQWAQAQLAPDWTTSVTTLDPPALALDASRNSFVSTYAIGQPAQIQKLGPQGASLWLRGLTARGRGQPGE